MLKYYLLFVCVIYYGIPESNAQVYKHPIKKAGQFDLQVRTGIHLPFSHIKSKFKPDIRLTGLVGISIRYFYTEFFSIQTGLEWVRKGGFYIEDLEDNISGAMVSYDVKRNFDYFIIPLHANFYFSEDYQSTDHYLITGLYVGFIADNNSKRGLVNSTVEILDQRIKDHDIGINLGYGVDFLKLNIEIIYNLGMTNQTTTNFESKLSNHGPQLSIIYTFKRF